MKNKNINPYTTEVKPVSENEFQAALAAYTDNMNSEIPAEDELEDTLVLTNKYWGVGQDEEVVFVAKNSKDKTSMIEKLKSIFKKD